MDRAKSRSIMGMVLVVAFGITASAGKQTPSKEPANVHFTKAAWAELEKGNFDEAIKNARKVIDDFEPDAEMDQEKLKKEHAPEPPIGPPATKKEEQDTLKRGPLNDVATCYWIMGQASEKKGDFAQAKSAYQVAAKFTYARTFDPDQDIFWSPANKGAARAKRMK